MAPRGSPVVKFALTFGQLNPVVWLDVAREADRVGFESLWLSEHLVIPVAMAGSPFAGETHPPVPPETPVYDAAAYLAHLAALTERVRLGTYVYLLGIRHPFISARAFATLDLVSGGRAVLGVGSGWLASEWEAVGLDPATRGARLDEAIGVCRRLWVEPVIEHHGTHFDFAPVAFEPKPLQQPVPIHVGGESARALRRAAQLGDGWLGMRHTPESAAARVAELRTLLDAAGRPASALEITVSGACESRADRLAWERAGVDRLIVSPWRRSAEAVGAITTFAGRRIGGDGNG